MSNNRLKGRLSLQFDNISYGKSHVICFQEFKQSKNLKEEWASALGGDLGFGKMEIESTSSQQGLRFIPVRRCWVMAMLLAHGPRLNKGKNAGEVMKCGI